MFLIPKGPSVTKRVFNVLFLCTGDAAYGILAESILNQIGRGRFHAFSAGKYPVGSINPFARELLETQRVPSSDLRSKSLDEILKPGAPALDFVFTVGENGADEAYPELPGQPMTAHWGTKDSATLEGVDKAKRYATLTAFRILRRRIGLFTSLPIEKLDAMPLQRRLNDIGHAR